ncbi:MAG: DUF5011 domain-containing protein, partial [Gammaproteobacteria bacterium]|nr:DUF5011 domain-containing protein [Gammaproteobacteria bacterium]
MGVGTVYAADMDSALFTMYAIDGSVTGTPDDTVIGSIGGGIWAVSSTVPFFGVPWNAHNGITFGPGTYDFDTSCAAGTGGQCGGTSDYTGIVVGTNQLGGHILFDWLVTFDIDVVVVWDIALSSVDASTILKTYTTTDNVGFGAGQSGILGSDPYDLNDGITGSSMIDGSFVGSNANFDFTVPESDTTPPAISLLGSNPQTIVVGDPYAELGADCVDAFPQAAHPTVITIDTSAVNTAVISDYLVTYDCVDTNLNAAATVTRTVSVVAPNAVTTLLGSTPVVHECESSGFTY